MNVLGAVAWVGGLLISWRIYGNKNISEDPIEVRVPVFSTF